MNLLPLAWGLVAVVAATVGATAAAARRELAALEAGEAAATDYAFVSRLRRLRDDAMGLSLRVRWSRALAGAGVPLALAALFPHSAILSVLAALLGALVVAVLDASGGGTAWRRLCRAREGAAYGAWARLTHPAARLARPVVLKRAERAVPETWGRVLAETQTATSPASGRLDLEERRFFRRLLASTTILVADVMTPWASVRHVAADTTLDAAMREVHALGRSRLPALRGTTPVGLLTVRDLLTARHRGHDPARPVDALLRPLYFVRQEETVRELLEELQEARVHLAVVVDRLGRPTGIVTMEDVLEEFVGELHDERERRGGYGR